MKKKVHIISHSHWDREWYMPFEYHRAKLVRLFDDCMDLFENDDEYENFHLDGHTVLLEDYLEIKPQNRSRIEKYVKEGKFSVGPWYVLQDEFLTSSEANVRNLLVGMKIAGDFGKVTRIGYFPDSFGNAGQMPQLLKQAGMKAIAFGRGVKPTGMNNSIFENENYQSRFSELYWQSPDGSKLPAVLFANWYNNGWEIPADGDVAYWKNALTKVEKYASTDQLLLMNGCDHQPVQKDLSQALRSAREKYSDYEFIHSDFEQYTDALTADLPENLTTIEGELTGQDTDGWFTLFNTASSHVDLKIVNKKCENLLENIAEPLSAAAAQIGKEYPHDMLLYAWKTLMKNHPHDSICGCSCDAVNDEMRTRFLKCSQTAETLIADNLSYLSEHVDTSGLENCEAVFAVINTYAKERSGMVSVDLDIRRLYTKEIATAYEEIQNTLYNGPFELIDRNGSVISCSVKRKGARFGYDLPEDRFRQPYVAETVTVTFEASDIPPMGYQVYGLRKGRLTPEKPTLVTDVHTMENSYIKVTLNTNGTIDVTDKQSHRTFCGLLRLEDVADLGSEYTFVPARGDIPIYSGEEAADIELVCDEAFMAEYKITTKMRIPVSADETAVKERNAFVNLKNRKGGRSKENVIIPIVSYVSISKNSRSVKVRTELNNTAKDHRLRVLFPTGIPCLTHKAESIYEAAVRDNKHKSTWTYPSGCDRQQGFVMLQDEVSGFGISNIGLHEYEILDDNIIALTLVRSVGEMGDWGIFPTELSQVQTSLSFEYELVPFAAEAEALDTLSAIHYLMQSVQVMKTTDAAFQNHEFVWEGSYLRFSALKCAQESKDLIMRWVNYSDQEQVLTVKKTRWISNLYLSNIIEEECEPLVSVNDTWKITVKPFEIITLGCKNREG